MRTSDVRRERELRRREGYRETILHAAERVILRKGFSALTMDDVAREAQLSKATIYKYVAGKGVLLFEIMGHNFDDIRDRVAGIVDGPGTAGEKLGQVVRIVLESGEDMKHVNRVLWMDNAVLKLMRVFAPLPGKAGAAPPADRKMHGRAPAEEAGAHRSRRPHLRGRRGLRRVPAHGHPARPRTFSTPSSRATCTCGSGRATRPLPPGRRRRPDPVHHRRDPEPRTIRQGELT